VARLQGRMAGVYAEGNWADNTAVYAAVFNAIGSQGRDPISDAIERSVTLNNPNVVPMGRYAATAKSAKTADGLAIRHTPELRLLLGQYAARAVQDLKTVRKPKPAKGIIAFALTCNDDVRAAIDANGRIKGCVDVDPAAAGTLLVDALARLFAGGEVPSLIDQDIAPYPADAATPAGTEVPAG
jgi:hypothetical protein